MLKFSVKFGRFVNVVRLGIDTHTHITGFFDIRQYLFMLAFSCPHNRCDDLDARTFAQRQYLVDDLVERLLLDTFAALRAMRYADACVEKAQVIIDFRYRTDRRARVV
ncbi:hypothetical protein SDC9_179594 [bioreactor metagenome]|uniref:Uncharacterized protein n=1 Tax=bioreactor metagenome TaxID=1076179 RepID=A0A645GZF5_9ZZZZ